MSQLICLGEALIDMIAEPGYPLGTAPAFRPHPGGAPANVAVAASKLGIQTAFLGKVGDDPFGRHIASVLAGHGVDTGGMRFDASYRTSLAFVAVNEAGVPEYTFYRNPGADMMYDTGDVDTHRIRRCQALHFGSISLLDEPSRSATLYAVRLARECGALVSYDPNLRPVLWSDPDLALSRANEGARLADVIKLTDDELKALVGTSDPAVGADLLMCRMPLLQLVAVTMGERGCYWRTAQHEGHVAGHPVRVADTVGCGDAFDAALLMQLLMMQVTRDILQRIDSERMRTVFDFANAAAALTATRPGAMQAAPTEGMVEVFLRRRDMEAKR